MKKVIRSLTYLDRSEKDHAKENLGVTRLDRLVNLTKTETELLQHIQDFYTNGSEAPSYKLVFEHFDHIANSEAVTYLEEAVAESFYEGASYKNLFEKEVETQATQRVVQNCKDGIKIAIQGHKIGNTTLRGADEAVSYLFSNLQGKPFDDSGRLKASMKKNDQALMEMYEERKAKPHQTYGVLTGYGLIDQATAGIRKKQFYLLAGYGGHLKSTLMLNMVLNAAVDGGWNPLIFTSEMPAEDLQQMLIAMHSANPKFNGKGRPIHAYRLLLGALQQQEEDFYRIVKDDLLNNSSHGSIRVVDTSEFTTFGSVMQRTVREHAEEEVDVLWVDYLTRLPIDPKYGRMEITQAKNEVLADAKRFAMSFNKGEGLPVCSPFQVNREGYKKACANEGRMDKTALAQYNAAEKEADVISYVFYDKDEAATSEPKIGLMKSRYGKVSPDPVNLYVDPDSRRMHDLSAGMNVNTGYAPTAGGNEDDVAL